VRIVYVTSTLPFGPVESFIVPEISALIRRGHEIVLAPVRPRGRPVHQSADALLPITVAAPLVSPQVVARAAGAVTTYGARATAGAFALTATGRPAARAKNAATFPKALWLARLVDESGADHIHAHWASTTATAAMVAARLTGVPWSMTAHRWDIAEANLLPEKAASAAFVRVISADGERDVRARIGGVGTIVRLHMGVELPPVTVTATAPRTARAPVAFVPASLVPVKGHDVLLRALARPGPASVELRAVLAGDGPLRARLEGLAAELGIASRVEFLGQLGHGDVLRHLESGSYDMVVLPSALRHGEKEGIPVALMEAMARSLPVIASDIGGVSELVGEGAGLLVAPDDDEALAEAMCRLAADGALRAELAAKGRARVAADFAIDGVADRLAALFADSVDVSGHA
jgi:glycosyltransferase involved in cell wall biosynthesis